MNSKKQKCKFCEWKKRYSQIYEDKYVMAAFGSPYVRGHVKIIIKKHHENLTDIEEKEGIALMKAWKEIGKAVQRVLRPDIINYQINCNWTRHVHGHIYPRWKTDKDWGEPIKLPTKRQVETGKYERKELNEIQKEKIKEMLAR